jgi:hypothetical protein
MQDRLDRLRLCAKRRQIAKDVMVNSISRDHAPDFTVSIRPGMPSLLVSIKSGANIYWQPAARLNRQLVERTQRGRRHQGVTLSIRTGFEREDTVMGTKNSCGRCGAAQRPARPHARVNGRELPISSWRDLGSQPDLRL